LRWGGRLTVIERRGARGDVAGVTVVVVGCHDLQSTLRAVAHSGGGGW
jgi:hypothetical protein